MTRVQPSSSQRLPLPKLTFAERMAVLRALIKAFGPELSVGNALAVSAWMAKEWARKAFGSRGGVS